MISVKCPACGASLRVKDEHAGKRGKCPGCSEPIRIPRTNGTTASESTVVDRAAVVTDETLSEFIKSSESSLIRPAAKSSGSKRKAAKKPKPSRQLTEVLASLPDDLPASRTSGQYTLALWMAAFLSLLIPVAYFATIASVAAFVFWHATVNVTLPLMGSFILAIILGYLVIYLAPLLGGLVTLYVLIMPLFSFRRQLRTGVVVSERDEPLLWHLVEQLCKTIGAPIPKEIRVESDANASASLRRGALSLIGNDLTLAIGLPLAGSLKVDQLAGIISHELGHFRQGSALKLFMLISFVNNWLVNASIRSSLADENFERIRDESMSGTAEMMFSLMQLIVAIPRGFFWILLQISSAVCGRLLREQEFDADRAEALIAGTKDFEISMRQVTVLGLAEGEALRVAIEHWKNANRLPDDLPALILLARQKDEERFRGEARKIIRTKRVKGQFETHPPSYERINRVKEMNAPGLLDFDEPATMLFRDYEGLCRKATVDRFTHLVGPRIRRAKFVSPYTMIKPAQAAATGAAADSA